MVHRLLEPTYFLPRIQGPVLNNIHISGILVETHKAIRHETERGMVADRHGIPLDTFRPYRIQCAPVGFLMVTDFIERHAHISLSLLQEPPPA